MKSIPELIALHGGIAQAARASGWSELTIAKYRDDFDNKCHIIHNDVLMTARTANKLK